MGSSVRFRGLGSGAKPPGFESSSVPCKLCDLGQGFWHVYNSIFLPINWVSLVVQTVKNPPAMQDTQVWSLSQEDPLEKGMTTHSSNISEHGSPGHPQFCDLPCWNERRRMGWDWWSLELEEEKCPRPQLCSSPSRILPWGAVTVTEGRAGTSRSMLTAPHWPWPPLCTRSCDHRKPLFLAAVLKLECAPE